MSVPAALRFLDNEKVRALVSEFGSPLFVYDEALLRAAAKEVRAFPNAFGLTARFAMKAAPNANILRIFSEEGLHFDASSGYEVERAVKAGIPAEHISLTAQEMPHNLEYLMSNGVLIDLASTHQISSVGRAFPGASVGLRFNPGLGSGGMNRTNTGGPASSFGIWHEDLELVLKAAAEFDLKVERIHTHIGSGSDPRVWQKIAGMSIGLLDHFPDVHTLNLGGGYKVARTDDEEETCLQEIGKPVADVFRDYAAKTGREIRLEVEPGTFLVANAGALVCIIQDVTRTGDEGYLFYKIDSGMTEILRPSIYGAQHPLIVVPRAQDGTRNSEIVQALVSGHCCESGDILTPLPGDPEGLKPRSLHKADIGDYLVVEGAGAYCSSMSAKNYNSFPEAAEVLIRQEGEAQLIRKRQTLDQILSNEIICV